MAVTSVNLARVSQNLRAFNLLEALREHQVGLYRAQTQLATGMRLHVPSDDPVSATTVAVVDRRTELLQQIASNVRHANSALTLTETAVGEAVELVLDSHNIALEAVDEAMAPGERESMATLIDRKLEQLIAVANRKHMQTYLFSGTYGDGAPFELHDLGGVIYHGDQGEARTITDSDRTETVYSVSGAELFGAVSSRQVGTIDLNPAITAETRIEDLDGAAGVGIDLDRVQVTVGGQSLQVDLREAATVGDVVDRLNNDLPASLTASLTPQGIRIDANQAGVTFTVLDVNGGTTARDLGIAAANPVGNVGAGDLDARVTLTTKLKDLRGGAGINLAGGITVRNGAHAADIDFTNAETVEDVLNRINVSTIGVWARITEDGKHIEVLNRVSGIDLRIEENGGNAAQALGIRTTTADTPLSELNDGRGVDTVDGNDIQITTANGTTFEVDVDGAETLQDVLDLLNAAGGGAITATLANPGCGLLIKDNTVGGGTLEVGRVNASPAIDGLGLDVVSSGGQVVGEEINPIRIDNVFTALIELRDGLRTDDRQAMIRAAQRLERSIDAMQEVQGRVASQARAVEERTVRMESEVSAAQVLLSDLRDADIADVAVRFTQLQTALQANLSTANRVANLSLLDYL